MAPLALVPWAQRPVQQLLAPLAEVPPQVQPKKPLALLSLRAQQAQPDFQVLQPVPAPVQIGVQEPSVAPAVLVAQPVPKPPEPESGQSPRTMQPE